MKKIFFTIIFLATLAISLPVSADVLGTRQFFNVDSNYDATGRSQVVAVLVKTTPHIYFYVDEKWWNFAPQSDVHKSLSDLGIEFESNIYPTLTNAFGSDVNPAVNKDGMITVLIEPMGKDQGGYFRSSDGYSKLQIPSSNEREMMYLNASYITEPMAKSLLAHEFMHLITFAQKDAKYDVTEDTWLNEARAEYVPTLLGYNDTYAGSYLEKKVQYFSEKPSSSLANWQDSKYDYGMVTVLVHYLVDQYGIAILSDSLHSSRVGVDSLNYALLKEGAREDFSKAFSNWVMAVLINDCSYGERYCFGDKNLKSFQLSPSINFLPLTGTTTLTISDTAKIWSGMWYKIIGGGGDSLHFSFTGDNKALFKVPYITKSISGSFTIGSMNLDKNQQGDFYLQKFGKDVTALFIIPVLTLNNASSDGSAHAFSWSASIIRNQENPSNETTKLLARIDELKKQIADILASLGVSQPSNTCGQITMNLYAGISNSAQVSCLQQFLKAQGSDIYPEGLVTGNFGRLTKSAVIKFQAKFQIPQTGFVGILTRTKINSLQNGG